MKKLHLFLIPLLAMACVSDKKEKPSKSPSILGTWENLSLKVDIRRTDQGDSILLVRNQDEWKKTLGIKPIVTQFNSDSTFSSKYYSLDGQLVHTTLGRWWVKNDSLLTITEHGEYAYQFTIDGDEVKFISNLDWDQDGIDDKYEGVQRRSLE